MKIKGFTLIEMVMTIVIMGIIVIGVGGLIELASKGYADTTGRQKVQNKARFVIEKMTREIRHAVPNSFQVEENGKCLTFYPIHNAGFYSRDEKNRIVEFVHNQGDQMGTADTSNVNLVINPSRPEDLVLKNPPKSSVSLSGCRDSSDTKCTEEVYTDSGKAYSYKVDDNFPSHSIASRYYSYRDKVSYCIKSSGLMEKTKTVSSNKTTVTVSDGLSFPNSQFQYEEATLQRGGLVHMDLLFINGDEESVYKHDVQVLNVP